MGIMKKMQLEEINRHCSECGKKEMSETMAKYQLCKDCYYESKLKEV